MGQPRSVEIGIRTREQILRGALTLARTVAVTFGPMGRNAIIDRFAGLLSTRDGVTLAREIDLPDALANQGCQLLKQACIKVNDEVGDGTTQTAILASEILREGHQMIMAGFHPNDLIRGMRAATESAVAAIWKMAIPVETQEQIQQVAFLASNRDEEVARLLADAVMAVGNDGLVVIEDGQGVDSSLEFKEGFEIDGGMASPHFVDDTERMTRTINAPLVAVVNVHLRTVDDVRDLMETASQWNQNELLVFCRSCQGDALVTMVLNHKKQVVRCCAVEAPGIDFRRPEILKDIAALSGATFVDPEAGFDHRTWQEGWFGGIRKATISQKNCLLEGYPESKDALVERIQWLKGQEAESTSDYDRDQLRKRMARLSGGLALLKIGGVTEAEMKDRRARVEDALGAVKAALRGGLVPGGGMAYISASQSISDCPAEDGERAGWGVIERALKKPLAVLADNAAQEGSAVVARMVEVPDPWTGWDVISGEVRDFRQDPPIVDPTLVPVTALESALSVAVTLLTVEASIFPHKE